MPSNTHYDHLEHVKHAGKEFEAINNIFNCAHLTIKSLHFNKSDGKKSLPTSICNRKWNKKQFITMLSGTERVASNAEQKSLVIKENAKYSFVELGKFNTTASTRRALQTAQPGERAKPSLCADRASYFV